MANTILTDDIITRKALEVLENEMVLSRNCNRQYDKSFAVAGAKIGDTLRIRLPDRMLVNDGPTLQVAEENQQYTTLTVSSQKNISLAFTSAEQTMKLDEFTDLIIKPRMSQMAAYIDNDLCSVYKQIGQSVGTPGTTPSTSAVLLAGQQKLNEAAAMMSPRYATVDPAANAGLVEGMKGLFAPVDTIAKQFKNGMMGSGVLGYDEINMSQSIKRHTTGSRSAGATVATTVATQGQTTIALTTNGASDTIKQGDVFTVASVYAVNPQTRESTGSLYQFVVGADANASGSAVTVTVPAMYTAANALATIDAFPVSTAAVTFIGGVSTSYPQNLIYHKDAITLATADLVLPSGGVISATRAVHNGISIRLIRDYDSVNDRMICRLDVLYGFKAIRPELAVRLWG